MTVPAKLAGRYDVRGILGEGAQGVTYDAVRTADGKAVAIKRFDVRGARSWKDVELAEREARVLSSLDHPLVARYLEHFEEDGALYLVMEKVEGETLDAIVRRAGGLPEAEVRRFLADADRALTYLHGRASPVVHRDIKPRNVVRRLDGTYVLLDFGVVSELVHRRAGASTIAGTIGYMAPEQLQGRALPATDVYAVGAAALAALTGAEPETLPHRGLRVDVEAALAGRASPALASALARMLEPDPSLRAPSLAAALDGVSGTAPSPPMLRRGPEWAASGPPDGAPTLDPAREDELVKSVRKLLWLLWGLGWLIVPLILGGLFHVQRLIPVVMFTSLAAVFVLTWHKGALLRAAIRALARRSAIGAAARDGQRLAPAPVRAVSARPRVEVDAPRAPQVRVHTSDLPAEDVVGLTEIDRDQSAARQRRI